MKVQHNIKTYSVTWLANTYDEETSTGLIENYYIPDDVNELAELCKSMYHNHEKFMVVGHTSNLYFLPKTNIKNIISTRNLTYWHRKGEIAICNCGVHVKRLVKAMVDDGIKGYACMIDLPGTVGAAIYGNAGVSHDSISNVLIDVEMLMPDGTIKTITKEKLKFDIRSSALKRHTLNGVILSCRLNCIPGDKTAIKNIAEHVHQWRIKNQPGPSRNLGTTTVIYKNNSTMYGYAVRAVAKFVSIILFRRHSSCYLSVILTLTGMKHLFPYLAGLNRYIWKDKKGHNYFADYMKLVSKMYKKPQLEIEVIK